MQVTKSGSVRVDLLGGTIDLEPINLILPNVVTLNVATSLKAQVTLFKSNFNGIEIYSEDYNKGYKFLAEDFTPDKLLYSDFFKEMTFLCQIIDYFGIHKNMRVELKSGAPAGSGLGGSSAMGITLYKALCEFTHKKVETLEAVSIVKGIEGRILNQGVPGYQDYFPALLGGVLALSGVPGSLKYEQLYSIELANYLQKHLILVYSGISRNSGINNWDVYKGFFDKNTNVRKGLRLIAELSYKAYLAIKNNNYDELLALIGQEGDARELLAPGIVPNEVKELKKELNALDINIGLKMCGAGGGGCFIITHHGHEDVITKAILKHKMRTLEFQIES